MAVEFFARRRLQFLSLLVCSAAVIAGAWPASAFAATQPRLGTALNFTVLAASTITNTNTPTAITGNLGLNPGTSVTGFPPGTVTGVKEIHNATALGAKNDLATAYNDAFTATSTSDLTGQDLGTKNLGPGVYTYSSSAQLTGLLTLTGNGVFIFQIGSTLTTASNAVVQVTGGAQACAVYWQIGSSATLGTGTLFQGNLMAHDSITMNTNANILTGRAMALGAALTLDNNVISPPVGAHTTGAAPTPTATPTATPTSTPTPSTTSTVPVPPTGAGSPGWILPVLGLGLIVGGLLRSRQQRRARTSS
jgi:hypothetical protein